jgi:hypothetical protein
MLVPLRKVVSVLALFAVSALALAPFAAAHPINAGLNWGLQTIVSGSTNTGTYGVGVDFDCPVGETFSGTLTVVEPDGISTATVTVGPTACGTTSLTSVYPTDFTGTAGTTQIGTYTATFAGSASTDIFGIHPEFKLVDNFVVKEFGATNVPEFSAPAMIVAVAGLVLLAATKRARQLKL